MEGREAVSGAIVWAMENHALSTVLVTCGGEKREQVVKDFREIFGENWKQAEKDTIAEAGVAYEKDRGYYPGIEEGTDPVSGIDNTAEGIVVRFDPILIEYCFGDFCEVQIPCDAVEKTFVELKEKHPSIEYSGLVAFPWSDRRCGDYEEYFVRSSGGDTGKVIPFVWKNIEQACSDDEFEEEIADEVDGMEEEDISALVDDVLDALGNSLIGGKSAAFILSAVERQMREDEYSDYGEEIFEKTAQALRRAEESA